MVYTVGLVGAGDIAYFHGSAVQALPERVRLAAVCDLSAEARSRFGATFSVDSRYTNLDEMLARERLDIVVVCTWGSTHAAIVKEVAQSGRVRAILCEKPISSTAAECAEMIAAARTNGVLLAEAFKFRHHPQHLAVQEIVAGGRIGAPRAIVSTFSGPLMVEGARDNWRFDRRRGGGSTYDSASYNIHHARYVVGAEPRRVFAVGQLDAATGIDHSTAITLEFPDGMTAQITTSYAYCYSQSVTIFGTRGSIRLDRPFNLRQPWRWTNPNGPTSFQVEHDDGRSESHHFPAIDDFTLQLAHLCDCLDTGQPHRISPENSLGNMRTIDAVYASMRQGTPIDLASE